MLAAQGSWKLLSSLWLLLPRKGHNCAKSDVGSKFSGGCCTALSQQCGAAFLLKAGQGHRPRAGECAPFAPRVAALRVAHHTGMVVAEYASPATAWPSSAYLASLLQSQ